MCYKSLGIGPLQIHEKEHMLAPVFEVGNMII